MKNKAWTGERLETFIFAENTNEHLHRYAMAMELASGKKVLDVACGEGYGSRLLAGVAAEVAGVDIDEATIKHATQKYQAPNLHFITGAADAIPFEDQRFDLVVSFETIEHHDRHEEMMQEIKRVLKPGGMLIISSPDKLYYSDVPGYKNPFHVAELYSEEFEALISKHFKHTQHFKQRSFNGSVMMKQGELPGNTPEKLYRGNYEKITQSGIEAMYCLAIASDEQLPVTGNSFFDGAAVLEKQFQELRDYVTGTVTDKVAAEVTIHVTQQVTEKVTEQIMGSRNYRVGSTVIRPLRYIKRLFNA